MQTVLVAEDEKMIRMGICTMIRRSGVPVAQIIECRNGQEALEVIAKQPVDVLFTDIRMPHMDGLELARRAHACPHPPQIVAISGYDDFSYAVEMMRSGVREYLLKPIERERIREILVKLEEELQQKRASEDQEYRLGLTHLGGLLLRREIGSAELGQLPASVLARVEGVPYVVLCTHEVGREEITLPAAVICLPKVEEQSVLIVPQDQQNALLQGPLKGHYVGVSAVHQEAAALPVAYRQTRRARCRSFSMCRPCVHYSDAAQEAGREDGLQAERIVHMLGTERMDEVERELEACMTQVNTGRMAVEALDEWLRRIARGCEQTYGRGDEAQPLFENMRTVLEYPTLWCCFDAVKGALEAFHERVMYTSEEQNAQKISAALRYIHENYHRDLNMAVVSNVVSMNYSMFSYAFKQRVGVNFVQYLKELRMSKAKELLRTTELRVSEVGKRVGIDNEKHFMKTFRAVCGVSPTEYRRNMQQEDGLKG